MKKDKVLQLINSFFEEASWKYKFDEERSLYTSGINMDSIIGNVQIAIYVREKHYKVSVSLPNKVEPAYLHSVAEYLHRANFGLNNGNFELDYNDGEVRYKLYVFFQGIELTKRIVEDSILIPLMMYMQYGKNMMKLMLGEGEPKELIEDAERKEAAEA